VILEEETLHTMESGPSVPAPKNAAYQQIALTESQGGSKIEVSYKLVSIAFSNNPKNVK